MNGAEQASNYVRCTLDTPKKQRQCKFFSRESYGDGWCFFNDYGTTDRCVSVDAARELRRDRVDPE